MFSEAFKWGSDKIWAVYLNDYFGCIVKNELQCWGGQRQERKQDKLLGNYYNGLVKFMVIEHGVWQWRCWEADMQVIHTEMLRTCLGVELKSCALGMLSQDIHQPRKQYCRRDATSALMTATTAPSGAVQPRDPGILNSSFTDVIKKPSDFRGPLSVSERSPESFEVTTAF